MRRKSTAFALSVLSVCALCQWASGQAASSVVLHIELENYVVYFADVNDYSKLAMDPSKTTISAQPRNFAQSYGIADIVSVNGQPAKGCSRSEEPS